MASTRSPPPKRIKLESSPSPELKQDQQDHPSDSDPDSEPEHCSICLQPFIDRTVIPTCSHQFCFECLLVWADQSRRCPLCSQHIGEYVIHRIRSRYDYQRHYLPRLRTSPLPPPVQAGRRGRGARGRGRDREREWGRRERREREEADRLDRAITRRRWLYEHDLYAKHVASNPYTRYKPYPTPAQFANAPDLISRTTSFLRRELRVWNGLDVEFLTTFIISLMKSLDIRSEAAVRLIAEFLDMDGDGTSGGAGGGDGRRRNAEHFAHEVYSYLRSPYRDLFVYDSVVQYDTPPDIPPPHAYEYERNTRWRASPRSLSASDSSSRSRERRRDRRSRSMDRGAGIDDHERDRQRRRSPRHAHRSRSRTRERSVRGVRADEGDRERWRINARMDGHGGDSDRYRRRSLERSRRVPPRSRSPTPPRRRSPSRSRLREPSAERPRRREMEERRRARASSRDGDIDESRGNSRRKGKGKQKADSPEDEGMQVEEGPVRPPNDYTHGEERSRAVDRTSGPGNGGETGGDALPRISHPNESRMDEEMQKGGGGKDKGKAKVLDDDESMPPNTPNGIIPHTIDSHSNTHPPSNPNPPSTRTIPPPRAPRTRTLLESVHAHLAAAPPLKSKSKSNIPTTHPRLKNSITTITINSNNADITSDFSIHTFSKEHITTSDLSSHSERPSSLLLRLSDPDHNLRSRPPLEGHEEGPNTATIRFSSGIPTGSISAPSDPIPIHPQHIKDGHEGNGGRGSMSAPDIMARTRARLAKLKQQDSTSSVGSASPRNQSEHMGSVVLSGDNDITANSNNGLDDIAADTPLDVSLAPFSGSQTSPDDLRARLLVKLQEEKQKVQTFFPDLGDHLPTATDDTMEGGDSVSVEAQLRRQAQLRVRLAAAKRNASDIVHDELGANGRDDRREEALRVRLRKRRS